MTLNFVNKYIETSSSKYILSNMVFIPISDTPSSDHDEQLCMHSK